MNFDSILIEIRKALERRRAQIENDNSLASISVRVLINESDGRPYKTIVQSESKDELGHRR